VCLHTSVNISTAFAALGNVFTALGTASAAIGTVSTALGNASAAIGTAFAGIGTAFAAPIGTASTTTTLIDTVLSATAICNAAVSAINSH
jgi:hypothetical protein